MSEDKNEEEKENVKESQKDSENVFKIIKTTVSELKKTERGKGILFFGVYFIFFLFVILVIRTSSKNMTRPEDYEMNSSDTYSVSKILEENYDFTYRINVDNNEVIYSGEKVGNIEKFTFNGYNYYYDGETFYVYSNDSWTVSTDPYVFRDFTNFNRLGEVIVDATYISKTEFDNGKRLFNYQISSNSLINRIERINTDILEVPNNIIFIADSEGILKEIDLDLSSYGKFMNICTDSFKITLEYSDFGNNSQIVNPIG